MLQSDIAIDHSFDLISLLERRSLWRVVWITLFGEVEDLIQLDDDFIDKLLFVCVLLILFLVLVQEFEEFLNHIILEQSIDRQRIAAESFKVFNQLVKGPRAAFDQFLTDVCILLRLKQDSES